MTLETKDEALDALEQARAEYIAEARSVAASICEIGASITVNDVRRLCPPPGGIDPRVMGAVLRKPQWASLGYVGSKRKTCHGRPVSRFQRMY